jgi:hypothetical protein
MIMVAIVAKSACVNLIQVGEADLALATTTCSRRVFFINRL